MSRADRVAERLAEKGVDLLLVTHGPNLRYLTGFTGSNGLAVVGRDVRRFVTDFRYVEQAAHEVPDFDREQGPQDFVTALEAGWPEGELHARLRGRPGVRQAHQRLRAVVPDRIELKAAGGVVEAERAVKEPGEIERIAAAAALADEVYVLAARAGPGRAHGARGGVRARARDAPARRDATRASRRSSPPARAGRSRTPRPATTRSSAARS